MGVSGVGAASSGAQSNLSVGKKSTDPVAEFMAYMAETPAQRMEDAWLAKHHLTKQQFDAMSPADKQKIMDQMKKDIELEMKQQTEKKSSVSTDL